MTLRAVARTMCMAALLMLCLPTWALFRLFGAEQHIVRLFLRGVARLLGLRIRIEGTPVAGNALYAGNHISWLDIPALGSAAPVRFIAKSEIAGWPVLGWVARVGGSVFVARQKRSEARAQADAVSSALTEGRPMALFAEGGTGDGVSLLPFRASLFAAAHEAAVAVQPVAIDYGARSPDIAWPKKSGFGHEVKRMLNRPGPVDVTLHFLAPFDGATLNRKALAARAHLAVARALRKV